MRPVSVTQTGTGRSAVIAADYIQTPFNATIATTISGAVVYNIQHTFDDIYAPTFSAATANWYTSGAPFSAATTSGWAQYDNPVRALSINVTSGAGSVTATYLQGIQY